MRAAHALSVVSLPLLAACGAAPPDDALFPLAAGRQWTYRVSTVIDETEPAQRERLQLTNRGTETLDGTPAWRRRSDSGIEYWLRGDASGIYRVASRNPLERTPQIDSAPRYVLKKPYVVGTEWDSPTVPYVLARKNESPHGLRYVVPPLPMRYRIEAVGAKVLTPAATFEGCMRVAGQASIRLYDDALRQFRDSPVTTTEWYCPDVGLVRLERREPSPTRHVAGGSVTLELESWH
ncbi:MAG: hypothetical protein V4750_03900 [Pseudomonadota bacterium]